MTGPTRTAFRVLLAALIAAALSLTGCADHDDNTLTRSDTHIDGAPGIHLAVREVSLQRPDSTKPPVLLLHGARVPGVASFDLPVPGGSLAADLANAGHRVFVMDARGYGGSTRPAAMDQPPTSHPAVARSDDVVQDVAAVVDHITARYGADQVALLGWATGGHWLGQYAATHPHRVSHLVLHNTLYGPLDGHPMLGRGTEYEDPRHPGHFHAEHFGAYRLNTAESLMPSWDNAIPVPDKSEWRDPAVAAAYTSNAVSSDPTSHTRTPPSFRAPTGALEDSFYLATGHQLWNAAHITARTLILRSEHDFWSRPQDLQLLTRDLSHATTVQAVTLTNATHHVHLDRADRGRNQFLATVTGFLATT